MTLSPYDYMQQAVDEVAASEHEANKIAATLSGKDIDGKEFFISKHNFWPAPIKDKIGKDIKIGNSSGTVHAETACIISAPVTNNSSMFVTDPPCPNCVKNMVEAGVHALFIDHKGFEKDFNARRGTDFRDISMEICAKAGINVYKIFRKEKRTESILHIAENYMPVIEKRARVVELKEAPTEESFKAIIASESAIYKGRPFAVALAEGRLSKMSMISAEVHAIAGFTSKNAQTESKYDLLLQPVHRVLMTASRHGLKINGNYIYCSRVPTAREQVNLVGSGLSHIYLGNDETARDEFGLQALHQLTDADILKVTRI